MSASSIAVKILSLFLVILAADASFFKDEVHLPSWFTTEFQNMRIPNVKEIPW